MCAQRLNYQQGFTDESFFLAAFSNNTVLCQLVSALRYYPGRGTNQVISINFNALIACTSLQVPNY
jgi:hypothetical protein